MILVTGATGFLGRTVCRLLDANGLPHLRSSLSLDLDLRDSQATRDYFEHHKPSVVLHCAAFVGGIQYGYDHPAELFTHNLRMMLNLFEAAQDAGVRRIVNPISNCVYPAQATFFKESELWDGPLHESVLAYGFARKASWVGSWAFARQYGLDTINLVLSNMYGPGDHFEAARSHALGALVRRIVDAHRQGTPEVEIWGTGTPVREWLYVEDGARAMIKAMDLAPRIDPINIGVGKGISIIELARRIQARVGYTGTLRTNPDKPDGAPYKTVDGSVGQTLLGWSPEMSLDDGLRITIDDYVRNSQ